MALNRHLTTEYCYQNLIVDSRVDTLLPNVLAEMPPKLEPMGRFLINVRGMVVSQRDCTHYADSRVAVSTEVPEERGQRIRMEWRHCSERFVTTCLDVVPGRGNNAQIPERIRMHQHFAAASTHRSAQFNHMKRLFLQESACCEFACQLRPPYPKLCVFPT